MKGLGKRRTKLGVYLDNKSDVNQEWLAKQTCMNRDSVSDLCDGTKYINPRLITKQKIISTLRKHGHDVNASDFW